jgi:hypothetical protein
VLIIIIATTPIIYKKKTESYSAFFVEVMPHSFILMILAQTEGSRTQDRYSQSITTIGLSVSPR